MKRLASIILPSGLYWADQFSSQGTTGVVRTALGGSAVVFGPAQQPRKITLIASEETGGWFTTAQADALLDLSRQPGPHVLSWYGSDYNVTFDHGQAAAVSLQPLWPNASYLTGTLSLIEV